MVHSLTLIALLSGCFYSVEAPGIVAPPTIDSVPVLASGTCAPERYSWVGCTIDGDTMDLQGCGGESERVRLVGVAAPEIAHPDAPAECYGDESAAALDRLVTGREVVLSFDRECKGIYGRTLAYIWLPLSDAEVASYADDVQLLDDGTPVLLVNTWMIGQGYAKVYPEERFGEVLLQDAFDAAESQASARGVGMWNACPG